MLFKLFVLLGLATSCIAHVLKQQSSSEADHNICQITANYGCTLDGINCNDKIKDPDAITFMGTNWSNDEKSWQCPDGDVASDEKMDRAVCCDENDLNGGYCPTSHEIHKAGYERNYRVGIGSAPCKECVTKAYHTLSKGKAHVKCNKRGGPHYCFNEGEDGCMDEGMYD